MDEVKVVVRQMHFDALVDGRPDAPLLIALHGLPRNRWEWHHQISPMAEMGYRVLAPDLRGFCHGARPERVESYHLDESIADTLAIADALAGTGSPFHLMGTSIGSSIDWGLLAHLSRHP